MATQVLLPRRQTFRTNRRPALWILLAVPALVALAHRPSVAVAVAAADAPGDAAKSDATEESDAPASAQASREQIEAEKAKARARMRLDGRRYSRQELQEAEQLYQVANNKWRSPEAKASLEQMVKRFPKFNRTGCATLYLGQYAEGAERERYLKQAVADFSDCFYGNGVQVGAYARYLLSHYYRDTGEVEKGDALLKELIKKYPKSVTHQGDQLAVIAKEDLSSPPAPK